MGKKSVTRRKRVSPTLKTRQSPRLRRSAGAPTPDHISPEPASPPPTPATERTPPAVAATASVGSKCPSQEKGCTSNAVQTPATLASKNEASNLSQEPTLSHVSQEPTLIPPTVSAAVAAEEGSASNVAQEPSPVPALQTPPPTPTPDDGSASEAQLVPLVGKNRKKNRRYAMNKLKRRAAALLAADPSLASASQPVSFAASPVDSQSKEISAEEKRRETECPGKEEGNGAPVNSGDTSDEQIGGILFHCNEKTKSECSATDPSVASGSQLVSFVARATAASPAADRQSMDVVHPSPATVISTPLSGGVKRRETECQGMEESNRAPVDPGDSSEAQIGGFVFHCNGKTKAECYARGIFGLPKGKAYLVKKIRDGTMIFLFDIKLRILYGLYRAVGSGGVELEPEAFGGKFPAQVRFMIDKDCPPLPESVFKDAIKENYVSRKIFKQVLNSQQVTVLYELFNQSKVHPGSFSSQTLRGAAATPSTACDPQTSVVHDTYATDVALTTETCGEKRKEREPEEKKMKSNRASIHPCSGKGKCEAQIEGFIFYCNGKTKPDCFLHRVFGLREKKAYLVENIRAGTMLFLLDIELRLLYGIYRATGVGMLDIEPQAFGGKFPAQVRFVIDKDCPPVHESVFKDAIKENYTGNGKFSQVLNSHQVNMLCSLFKPINVLLYPVPCQQFKYLPGKSRNPIP